MPPAPRPVPPYPSGAGLGPSNGYAVSPDDNANLPIGLKEIWVGGAGILVVTLLGGDTVTLIGVAAGVKLTLNIIKVWSTGTTTTGLVGLY